VIDSPKSLGRLPAGHATSANFLVEIASPPPFTKVDMVVGVRDKMSGSPVQTVFVHSETLEVDGSSTYYSTDFPFGGTETRDYNGNESVESLNAQNQNEPTVWSSLHDNGRNGA
jgi:hypothetical protein